MRTLLLATTILGLSVSGVMAQSLIGPGGNLKDTAGTSWTISSTGSIQKNGQWVPGGGETSALTIRNGVVYGEDSTGRGWFTLSGDNLNWSHAQAPAGVSSSMSSSATPTSSSSPAAPCGTVASGAATGSFSTANGHIYDPSGKPFIAKGINVMHGNNPSASTLQSMFPGINFVRLAIYDYNSPASLSGYVEDMTGRGIVVLLENHASSDGQNRGGGTGEVFSGPLLASEQAWYQSIASAFKNNPAVWFGTNNEPPASSLGALASWQRVTYETIRATGNNSIVVVELPGGGGSVGLTASMPSSPYAGMRGFVWDLHPYGWISGYSTDQAAVNSAQAANVTAAQQVAAAPVILAEYGNSTTGVAIDQNADQVLTAVHSSGLGSAAWAWGPGNPGDGLTTGGNGLSAYGQRVAGFIALTANAAASVWACSGAAMAVSSERAVASASIAVAQAAGAPASPANAPLDQAKPSAELAAAQAQIADLERQNQVLAAKVQTQLDAAIQRKAAGN